jgi:hypothetical protein
MTPIERLKKLLEQATIPYEKPSIVFKDNARVIVWADNEKGRDIATFRHSVTMEADAMLYIEAVRLLPALLAAYDTRGEEIEEWRNKCGKRICDDDGSHVGWGVFVPGGIVKIRSCKATDSAVARVEGE